MFVFLALAATVTVGAKEVSQKEALQVANDFFSGGVMTASAGSGLQQLWDSNSLSASADGISLASVENAPTFYVFAPASGKGFVIVSGDDAARPVLGYSFENDMPATDQLSCNLRFWFEQMDGYITSLRSVGAAAAAETAQEWATTRASSDDVVLETAAWSQYAPYYWQCPLSAGGTTITGCVQTAFAIVMRYYQWPESAHGVSDPYTTETDKTYVPARCLEHEYDWDLMPLSYSSYTTEQGNEVAKLMADLGYALQADYNATETGTWIKGTFADKLHEHFGYSQGMHWEHGNMHDTDEWYQMLRDEIDKGRPVPFWAFDSTNSYSHMFLIDGYSSGDYFDINLGWAGSGSGMFLLPDLTYNTNQLALMDFVPEEEGEEYETPLVDELENKSIKLGSSLSSVSAIEEGQWYVVSSNYSANSGCYLRDASGDLYLSNGSDVLSDGMLATDAASYLVRFSAAQVSGYSNTYYMQFGTGNYANILSKASEYISTHESVSDVSPVCAHDMSSQGGGPNGGSSGSSGHVGFYTATSTKYSIYAAWGPDMWAISYNSSGNANSGYDFSIYPVELEDLDETGLALAECQKAYRKYSAYVGVCTAGTIPGCYGANEVAAFETSVSAAAVCVGSDAGSLDADTLNQLAADMESAFSAMTQSYVSASLTVDDGYYFIEPAGYDFSIEPAIYLYTHYNKSYVKWNALESSPEYLWKVTNMGDEAYEVRNMSSDETFDDITKDAYATLSSSSESLITFSYAHTASDGNTLFNISTSGGASNVRMWAAGTDSGSGTTGWVWGGTTSGQDAMWKLVPVSEEEADAILGIFYSHECEAEIDHWTTTGNNGTHEVNTWSTEADASGMVTPFCQNWVYGELLTDATISHTQFTGLSAGTYKVTVDARIFAETAVDAINEGTTLNVNDESIDLTTGTAATYGSESEVYGTYTLLCDVGSEGTLDISFHISNANYNWLAWKNLSVDLYSEDMPEVTAVEGKMNNDVAAAQTAALSAYASDASAHNYNACVAAIAAARNSVAYYASIAAFVDALDEAGLSAWQATEDGAAYEAGTLTNENVTASLVVAQRAQTTAGSDLSLVAQYDGTWTCPQGNGPGVYGDATETYNEENYSAGKVIYNTISDLTPGTYTVTFYAVANNAWKDTNVGDGIAQVYANGETADITVNDQTACTPSDYEYSFTVIVGAYGTLEFGIQNVAEGGNWYVCQAVALTLETGTSALIEAYEEAMAAAVACQSLELTEEALAALGEAIEANTLDLDTADAATIEAATQALLDAVAAAQEVATGINGVSADEAGVPVYTIGGMRVSDTKQKGVYIQDGKKIVVK